MAEDKVTPEEKLLKAIENPINVKAKPLSMSSERPREPLSFKKWLGNLKQKRLKARISFKGIYKALMIGSIAITIIGVFIFVKGHNDLTKHFKNLNEGLSANLKEEKEKYPLSINLAEAINDTKIRNIFTSLPAKSEAAAPKLVELAMSNLKLVGILWSDNPQAMIEDVSANKTFLLGRDEALGDFKIKKILRDRIIIGKDTQEWELR